MPKDGVLGEGGSKIEAELLEIFGLRKNDYFYSYANKLENSSLSVLLKEVALRLFDEGDLGKQLLAYLLVLKVPVLDGGLLGLGHELLLEVA